MMVSAGDHARNTLFHLISSRWFFIIINNNNNNSRKNRHNNIIIIRIIKQITINNIIYMYIVFLEWYQEQLHLQSFYGRRARRTLGSWRQRRSANCRCVSAGLRGFDRNGSREPRSDLPYGKRLQNWLVVWICLFSPIVGMMIQSD